MAGAPGRASLYAAARHCTQHPASLARRALTGRPRAAGLWTVLRRVAYSPASTAVPPGGYAAHLPSMDRAIFHAEAPLPATQRARPCTNRTRRVPFPRTNRTRQRLSPRGVRNPRGASRQRR